MVPIEEIDQWTDLPKATSDHLMQVAKNIGNAQKHLYDCSRVALIIVGFEVPHCHLHVIPAKTMSDLSFDQAASHVDPAELAAQAQKIASILKTI